MPRPLRTDIGDMVYHVINRSNARLPIFNTPDDFLLFESVFIEAREKFAMRLFAYCVMPNHWHLVVQPRKDGDLSLFMGWLTMTHTQRRHAMYQTAGAGHFYQGRYKSFLVETDEYLLQVCRYVERNALRAKLVRRAEEWRWGSAWKREQGATIEKTILDPWPCERPRGYLAWLNGKEDAVAIENVRLSIRRGQPFGSVQWQERMVRRFGLRSTLRSPGRPKNGS